MKISMIGVGKVGSTLAYALVLQQQFDELVLIGKYADSAEGDALDLTHAQPFTNCGGNIRAGSLADSKDSDIVVLCASAPMPEQVNTRTELGKENVALFKELIPELSRLSPNAVYLVVTNPVDIMTYFTISFGKLDPKQVIGTGTLIDSARFRYLHSKEVSIHPNDLRTYILGEHGDSQFPFFSKAFAGGEALEVNQKRVEMFEATKKIGYEIVQRKGFTNFAVASAANYIIESIIRDAHYTMPVSTLVNDFLGVKDVCLSLPAVVGRNGITRVFRPDFNESEAEAFRRSAASVQSELQTLLAAV